MIFIDRNERQAVAEVFSIITFFCFFLEYFVFKYIYIYIYIYVQIYIYVIFIFIYMYIYIYIHYKVIFNTDLYIVICYIHIHAE